MTTHQPSAELRARELQKRLSYNYTDQSCAVDSLTELTAIIRERDELREANKGMELECVRKQIAINEALDERDSYREKAEALDCFQSYLEHENSSQQLIRTYSFNGVTTLELYDGKTTNAYHGDSLLSAINEARKK